MLIFAASPPLDLCEMYTGSNCTERIAAIGLLSSELPLSVLGWESGLVRTSNFLGQVRCPAKSNRIKAAIEAEVGRT
jgi:hypothetical protein